MRRNQQRIAARKRLSLGVVLLLLVSLSSGLAGAQAANENEIDLAVTSAENDYATCTATSSTLVTCSLKIVDNQSSLDLTTDIMPLAQQINADIQTNTVMWLQAWGGKGGKGGTCLTCADGGWGGFGGYARTITTIEDYLRIYDTTKLHYYFGGHGENNASEWGSGSGGASTIVASVAQGFAAGNVLLIAGGGGGGNYGVVGAFGQEGGHGGTATPMSGQSVYGAGQNLAGYDGTVRGGSHYGPGQGSPSINPSDYGNGGNGFGGWGGGDSGSGGDNRTFWLNGDPGFNRGDDVTPGSGIGAGNSPGGPSGGGYGGGGMNACGGGNGGARHNCAGPGAGTYAAGITRLDGSAPSSRPSDEPSNAEVTIVFNVAPASYAFAAPVANPFGIKTSASAAVNPTFVDINADGTQDLFIGRSGSLDYAENKGTATDPEFANPVQQDFMVEDTYGRPAFTDINDDGDFDIFIGTDDGQLAYYENIGSPTNPEFSFVGFGEILGLTGIPKPASPAFGDLNGDGLIDLLISGGPEGDTYFYENQGTRTDPSFAEGAINPFGITPLGASGPVPALVDPDDDGVLDLFVGGPNGSTSIYQNAGTGTEPDFLPRVFNPFGLRNLGTDASPTFVDIDRSGTPDAFIGSGSGNIWFFKNNYSSSPVESGAVTEPVPGIETTPDVEITVFGDGSQPKAILYGSADFDASRVHRDIVSFEDWLGNQLAEVLRMFWTAAIGDVNGDGYLDQTLTFYSDDPLEIEEDIYNGREFCVRGVTMDGVEFEACNFVE